MCHEYRAVILLLLTASSLSVRGEVDSIETRPVRFPQYSTNCPVSEGRHDVVPHDAENVFCASCAWHGDGPVRLAFASVPANETAARFALSDVRKVTDGVYSVKTPVVAKPEYEGSIVIRGKRLDDDSEDIVFEPGSYDESVARFEAKPSSKWSFWGWGMRMSSPGCYALQIDTEKTSSILVFEATE